MKPAALKPDTYIDFDVEFNAIKAKMKIGHNVRLTKCKNLSARGYQQNCLEKAFAIKSKKLLRLKALKMQQQVYMWLQILIVNKLLEQELPKKSNF